MKSSPVCHGIICIIIALAILSFPGLCNAQGTGAFYWGDADGNGDIGAPDLTALNAILDNLASSDGVYYA
jgi:hypothetical protein